MNKTYIKYFFFILIITVFFSSCLVEPKYPIEPRISYKSFEFIQDSLKLRLTFNFRDGDGDLGLNQASMEDPKFDPFIYFINPVTNKRDSSVNPDFYNISLTILVKNAEGNFEELEVPDGLSLNGRFPRLISDEKAKPIEGSISYDQVIQQGLKQRISNKTIKMRTSIRDRALHQSNEIETDSLVIPVL
jgi:hypothetical protein